MAGSPPVVLVHGAWHGAWCWDRAIPPIEAQGLAVDAIELPFTSPEDDVACAREALVRAPGAIAVGHSYGGVVISAAAAGLDVSHLVYLCALMPDRDEEVAATIAAAPRMPLQDAMQPQPDGSLTVDPSVAPRAFYLDCDPQAVADAVARLRPVRFGPDGLRGAPEPAWHSIPSTYVVCAQDQALAPSMQRSLAKRATRVVEWDTSHSPFLSRPELLAGLLGELAAAGT